MSEKLFEVFLGTYNAEPWIENVIHSLENQDTEPFSVKIIDNASTDRTVEIVEYIFENYKLKNSYELIRNDANIGAISSFLDRLELFEAEWIFMVHQDDYYHPDHFSTLISEIQHANKEVSVIFTAMQRMDAHDAETISIPTLSSLVSPTNRVENFLLTLQLSPINFPACALRKSVLRETSTAKHTTAFNDVELLLRMMCKNDVKYIPKETMHYRVFPGNAASITSTTANDVAVSVGLIELFHSTECQEILQVIKNNNEQNRLIKSINSAVNIRISNQGIQNQTKVVIGESLIRFFGYSDTEIKDFLVETLNNMGLNREAKTIKNLHSQSSFKRIAKSKQTDSLPNFVNVKQGLSLDKPNKIISKFNSLSLKRRENMFDQIFTNPFFTLVKRPFVKVWRSRGDNE
jgi:glycosyltransferase involved in cell wall biosynthesis